MDDPAEQNEPESRSQDKLDGGYEQAALLELFEFRVEEAAKCRNDVAGGSLLVILLRK